MLTRRRKDFTVQTFRCGGRGGQKQNKTETGVRIIDKETGLRAESRVHRDQLGNKREAFRKLVELLKEHYIEQRREERYGNTERIRTYHAVDGYVEDHASGVRVPFTEAVDKAKPEAIDQLVIGRLSEVGDA
jgi:protein subunit release factor A